MMSLRSNALPPKNEYPERNSGFSVYPENPMSGVDVDVIIARLERYMHKLDWKNMDCCSNLPFAVLQRTIRRFPWNLKATQAMYHKIPLQFICQHNDLDWDWEYIGMHNAAVTIDFMLAHKTKSWEWCHSDIAIHHLLEHPDVQWNWRKICNYATQLTFRDVLGHMDLPWNWERLSQNPDMCQHIFTHPHLPWDWKRIKYNGELKHMTDYPDIPWRVVDLNHNPHVTVEYLRKAGTCGGMYYRRHDDRRWDWWVLSARLPILDILASPALPWDWNGVSANPGATLPFILKNPFHPWVWSVISRRVAVADATAEHPFNIPWDWEGLSDIVTLDEAQAMSNEPWVWPRILNRHHRDDRDARVPFASLVKTCPGLIAECKNECYHFYCTMITLDDIKNHPDVKWDWRTIATLVCMSVDDVDDNIIKTQLNDDIVYWRSVSCNSKVLFTVRPTDRDVIERRHR